MKNIDVPEEREVVFVQYDIPPLKAAEYTITLKQKTNQQAEDFTVSRRFAVSSERFSFNPDDINSNFPQNLANGEFAGVLPHVLFNRRVLPWERNAVASKPDAPWLAVLLLNEDELQPLSKLTAKDLVPEGTPITVKGSAAKSVGQMKKGIISYPGINKLDYGEDPDDAVNVLDLPADLFNKIAPAKNELPFLAHIRKTQTLDKTDELAKEVENFTVVLGNRLPRIGSSSKAFLVSLENFGDLLPDDAGKNSLPAGTQTVRLLCYLSWSFTVNDRDESFKNLLEHLNKNDKDEQGLTVLQVPVSGVPPAPAAVKAALDKQSKGTLSAADAVVLVNNALLMGYTPYNHHMRHGDHTVSWYRGPLLPYAVKESIKVPLSCSDAANRYNPDTGLFDVSYGAAWQLGQLLALQNKGFSAALYNWKKSRYAFEVKAAEQKIIDEKYAGITAFGEIFNRRKQVMSAGSEPPEEVVKWLAKLSLLHGVPFNYLVPDERMLPPESLRFFHVDNNWVDAVIDGAFSIGRATTASMEIDAPHLQSLLMGARQTASLFRKRKPSLRAYVNNSKSISGCLLRSAVLRGWPGLEMNGYSDVDGKNEINKLRMVQLSEEVMLCIFDGEVQRVSVHEPPEALHAGVEGTYPAFTASLRVVQGNGNPGSEIPGYSAPVPVRNDQQTIQIERAAANIKKVLNEPPLKEGIVDFSAAQFGLEMIKGVVKVDFKKDIL